MQLCIRCVYSAYAVGESAVTKRAVGEADLPEEKGLRPTAIQRAYEMLRAGIMSRRFGDGEFLVPEDIGRELGISRTPVREALALLQAEGLVELRPRKGAFVRPITAQDITEVFDARLLLEMHACDRLGERIETVVPKLREILEDQAVLIAQGQVEEFIARDRDFHVALVAASQNSQLVRFYENLRDQQLRMGVRAVSHSPERLRQILAEHESIIAALESGDVEGARKQLRLHLDTSFHALMSIAP
jgi:DNA-binding GntR family transcriptional regulator